MFQIQQVSRFGTSTPAVARTTLQGSDILKFVGTPEQQQACMRHLWDMQRHLLKCVDVVERLKVEIDAGKQQVAAHGFRNNVRGPAISLPGVNDLENQAESFLQSAKLAIAATGNLVEPYYGKSFKHLYQNFLTWAKEHFGEADQFAAWIAECQKFVRRVVDMRNAVDHPEDLPGKKLVVNNFRAEEVNGAIVLLEPSWYLLGESPAPLLQTMEAIIEKTISIGEGILIQIFSHQVEHPLLEIQEVPIEHRDPNRPVRFIVGIPLEKMPKDSS